MDFDSVEVKKLIEFAYYLHEKDMEIYSKYNNNEIDDVIDFVPLLESEFIMHPVKKLANGLLCSYFIKEYGHSSAIPSIILDVIVGKYIEEGFIYDTAVRFHFDGSLNNKDISERALHVVMLKPDLSECIQPDFPIIRGKKRKGIFDYDKNIPKLVMDGGYGDFFDDDNVFSKLDEKEKLEIFLKAMQTIGFRKDDVIALLRGKMSADEVFMAVAPPEIAHKRVLCWNQRKYTFSDNVLVSIEPLDAEVYADIGASLDELPFPFSGPAIIDAALVNTYGIDFGENARRHRLVNVNCKEKSIYCAKLKNAIIEEPIDLAKVDATDTEFGHQVIMNLDKSIGNLRHTTFSYAVDIYGNKFNIDMYGRLKEESLYFNEEITSKQEDSIEKEIDVMSDASNYEAVIEGFNNGAEGVGLVRMEDMLTIDGVPIYKSIFILDDEEKRRTAIENCVKIQRDRIAKILSVADGRRVVFRLLDAKLGEILTEEQIYRSFFSTQELRGDAALCRYPEFLEAHVRAILETASKIENATIDILIPLNYSLFSIETVKKVLKKVSEEIGYYNYRIGAMVEYVWFVNRMDNIASKVDFIAIGLNDLTEDVIGLPRQSRHKWFALLNNSVKDVIKEGVYRARIAKPNIRIGICGLHTNFAENLDFFRELQIDYITCNANFIPTAKRLVSIDGQRNGFSMVMKQNSDKASNK